MTRSLGVLAIALSLLGCSAQAHVSASASTKGAQTAGAEALAPRESTWEKESREEAMIAERAGTPAHESGAVDSASAAADGAIAPKARGGKKHGRAKAKKHQNRGAQIAAAADDTTSDRDRGHGNDLDRVDEDNPGKSKKKSRR